MTSIFKSMLSVKTLVRAVWKKYVGICQAAPNFALPMPNALGVAGSVWCHPAFFRHAWPKDEGAIFTTLSAMLKADDVCFDIGANIGQTAIVASRRVGAQGRVVAFEPALANVELLKYHLRWNRIKNVHVESVCIGNSVGVVDFYLQMGGRHNSNSLMFGQDQDLPRLQEKPILVKSQITTVDHYCAITGLRPNVLKIDVEGAELDVLQGARETLMSVRPLLLLGLHPFWWPKSQSSDVVTRFLLDLGYRVQTVDGKIAVPEEFADYVCIPAESSFMLPSL